MDKLYICKDEDCGNTLEKKGNLCCHSCTSFLKLYNIHFIWYNYAIVCFFNKIIPMV